MSEKQIPPTLTDFARALSAGILNRIAAVLLRFGVHPDAITVLGLIFVAIAAIFIAGGEFFIAAVLLLFALPMDAVDGALARAMNRKDKFGAVLDSSLDRYADGLIFGALSYHFASQDQFEYVLLALFALLGSFLVSYVRARAEGVEVDVKIGLFTRLERLVAILLMLLIPVLLIPGLWLLAIGTNFTSLQRLLYVRRHLIDRE